MKSHSAGLRLLPLIALVALGALLSALARADAPADAPLWSAADSYSASELFDRGNEALRGDRWGEAIVLYERALRIEPRADDVKHNLALAREHAGVEPPTATFASSLSPREWSYALGASLFILTLLLLVWTLRRHRWMALPAIAALGVAVLSAQGLRLADQDQRRVVVLDGALEARLSPLEASEVVFAPVAGSELQLEATHGTWAEVSSGEHSGWVPLSSVAPIVPGNG